MRPEERDGGHELSAREAARFLGLSPRLLKVARERAGLPHRRVGRGFTYPLDGLRRWAGLGK